MTASLPPEIEGPRRLLEADPLDETAAEALRGAIEASPVGAYGPLREALGVLDGGVGWEVSGAGPVPPSKIDRALHEALVVHPREKQERHHTLASLLGRVLHLLQGDETARTIARVTEQAGPESFPRVTRLAAECGRALEVSPPAIHVARGEEPVCGAFVDRTPFLCVHRDFLGEGEGSLRTAPLSAAELRFALAHQLEHVKGSHVALLQITPERLEGLLLDQLPFLIKTPVKFASKAVGWTRANEALRKVGEWMPEKSAGQRVFHTVGDLLPGADQETVLPEVVHDWVWSWIQGVEFSADRAGLLLAGGIAPAASAMLRLSPRYGPKAETLRKEGARRLLRDAGAEDRPTAERLRELLRFAFSREYLEFLAPVRSA